MIAGFCTEDQRNTKKQRLNHDDIPKTK